MLPTISEYLRSVGLEITLCELEPGRTNVLGSSGKPRLLFTTHLDTVGPHVPPRIEGDWLVGRGACDAKGQIVCQLEAIRCLRAEGIEDVAWLGVVGEETDALGAQSVHLLAPLLDVTEWIVAGEPTGLALASGQRGYLHVKLSCAGVAAHSGTPELGRCAILALLDWIERIRRIDLEVDPDLGPEVWSVGRVDGGTAANVVASHATGELVCRTVPDSRFLGHLQAITPLGGSVSVLVDEPPTRYPAIHGFEQTLVPFGSDLPTLCEHLPQAQGVLLGPGSISVAHTQEERIHIPELSRGVEMLVDLAKRLLGGPKEGPLS